MVPEKVRKDKGPIRAAGWPSLQQAMEVAQINTPRRVAAFLVTIGYESFFEYDIEQFNDTRLYKGRGFIQLTGVDNYDAAGEYLGVDLIADPTDACSLEWSAKIAQWYWTKARPRCNEYADNLQMGKVNGAIGYPLSGDNDQRRCLAFQKALQYLTGGPLDPVDCAR
jgi:putative chitinase